MNKRYWNIVAVIWVFIFMCVCSSANAFNLSKSNVRYMQSDMTMTSNTYISAELSNNKDSQNAEKDILSLDTLKIVLITLVLFRLLV